MLQETAQVGFDCVHGLKSLVSVVNKRHVCLLQALLNTFLTFFLRQSIPGWYCYDMGRGAFRCDTSVGIFKTFAYNQFFKPFLAPIEADLRETVGVGPWGARGPHLNSPTVGFRET